MGLGSIIEPINRFGVFMMLDLGIEPLRGSDHAHLISEKEKPSLARISHQPFAASADVT
jgi:hypothetical protein